MAEQLGFFMDMVSCYGCQTCEVACKSQNRLPDGVRWRRVRFLDTETPASRGTLSMSCNHCADPACLKVCPVGAYTKRADGLVIQDHAACIGCRMCAMACPYETPQYDPKEGKVSKCDGCHKRLDKGLPPRCVEACPGKALAFGRLADLQAEHGTTDAVLQSPSPAITGPSIVIRPMPASRR